jgi:L-threonate 2-dehydrogenase
MIGASDEEIAAADFVLSILPPGALALAKRFAPVLAASNAKPVYVDCNAINPATVERVAAAIAPSGCLFVDAGIIGPPPPPISATQAGEGREGVSGPRLYASGAAAARVASLRQYGLDVRVLETSPVPA